MEGSVCELFDLFVPSFILLQEKSTNSPSWKLYVVRMGECGGKGDGVELVDKTQTFFTFLASDHFFKHTYCTL